MQLAIILILITINEFLSKLTVHDLIRLLFSVSIEQPPLLSNRNSCSEKRLRTNPSKTEQRQVIQAKPPRNEPRKAYVMCAQREILC